MVDWSKDIQSGDLSKKVGKALGNSEAPDLRTPVLLTGNVYFFVGYYAGFRDSGAVLKLADHKEFQRYMSYSKLERQKHLHALKVRKVLKCDEENVGDLVNNHLIENSIIEVEVGEFRKYIGFFKKPSKDSKGILYLPWIVTKKYNFTRPKEDHTNKIHIDDISDINCFHILERSFEYKQEK